MPPVATERPAPRRPTMFRSSAREPISQGTARVKPKLLDQVREAIRTRHSCRDSASRAGRWPDEAGRSPHLTPLLCD